MRHFDLDHFKASREMEFLNKTGKAWPIGPATDYLQWVCTDKTQRVVKIALVPRNNVRMP